MAFDLWKLQRERISPPGHSFVHYKLTKKGSKALFWIDLNPFEKAQHVTLQGPYKFTVTGISHGAAEAIREADFRWNVDWDASPLELKGCMLRDNLQGYGVAVFDLYDDGWRLRTVLNHR